MKLIRRAYEFFYLMYLIRERRKILAREQHARIERLTDFGLLDRALGSED